MNIRITDNTGKTIRIDSAVLPYGKKHAFPLPVGIVQSDLVPHSPLWEEAHAWITGILDDVRLLSTREDLGVYGFCTVGFGKAANVRWVMGMVLPLKRVSKVAVHVRSVRK